MNDDEFLNDRDCTPKGGTPRTDAILEAQYGTLSTLSRLEDHARELERELARAMLVVEAARQWASGEVNGGAFSLRHEINEWEAGR